MLACTGDLMCEPRQHKAYKYGETYFFHPMFRFVRNILRDADFSVGNLETTISDMTPYADRLHALEGGGYHCNAPASYLDAIRYAGFDALVNANNHNCDSAVTGLVDTLNAMDERQFMHTGTFLPDRKERAIYVKVNGIKLAILSYATYFNKLETNFTQLGRDTLLNEYSEKKVIRDVAAARRKGAEFVLAYIHWGKEYTNEPTQRQRERAQQMANAGVDYIVGSHPHALQPYTVVEAADGRKVPCVFSLGNFVTNEAKLISKRCGILQIALEKANGAVTVKGDYFIPCYVFNQMRTSSFSPVPTDMLLSEGAWYETLPETERTIMKVMGDIPRLGTATITGEEICEVLGVTKPKWLSGKPFTRLCSKPGDIVDASAYFGIIWNGNTELQDAHKRGAAAIITDKEIEGLPCIKVDDVCEAYCKVYAHIRSRFSARAIAVTGNAGKTTTKEILDCILRDNYITLSSQGNCNTRHTAMLCMQQLRSYHEVYLQEVHEGDPRSAEMISRAITPDYAIITNVGISHSENFANEEEFKKAFTEITAGMSPEGILFANGDDPLLMDSVAKYVGEKCKVKTFGANAENLDYKIENLVSDGKKLDFDIVYDGNRTHIVFPSPFKINAYSAASAFAVGVSMGLDAASVAKSVTKYVSRGIRQNLMEYDGLKLLLDCRSVTPVSLRSSIETICAVPVEEGSLRIAVLGEMHIVEDSPGEHAKIGAFIANNTNLDYVFCYGENAQYICSEAVKCGFPAERATYFKTKRELELELCSLLKPGDALLIKGGRRMYLNTTIRKLFGLDYPID